MNDTPFPRTQHGDVLAGVKAKPSGWPTASLDTGSGCRQLAANGSRGPEYQDPPISGLYAFRGLPDPLDQLLT
jgi:hypothetical protein